LKVVGRPRFELGTFAVSELDEANLDVLTRLDDRPVCCPPSNPPFMLSMARLSLT
jgi:hypothetical protein